jgi:hypothetical protein
MTLFGIKLFDDVDLPEFPFPDLGRPKRGDGAPERPTASPPATAGGSWAPAWQRSPAAAGESALVL